jgi:hypothetical protein
MWNDFTDFELADLAGRYGIEDSLVFEHDSMGFWLVNRKAIEISLTRIEYDIAFPLDNNSELEYN